MTRQATAITARSFMRDVVEASLHLPVLVNFWAPGCAPCDQLTTTLDGLATQYVGRLRFTKVDTRDQQTLTRQLGIRALPTVVLFKGGTSVAHFTGMQSAAYIRHLFDQHLPQRIDNLLERIQLLKVNGHFTEARTLLTQALANEPDNILYRAESIALQVLDGDLQLARDRLRQLQAHCPRHPAVQRLNALLSFSEVIARQPDVRALRAQADSRPGHWHTRHALAVHQLLAGDVEPALQYWLTMLQHPAQARLAYRSLLHAFELIGDADPIVGLSRQQMAQLLS